MDTKPCAQASPPDGRTRNLARDLKAADVATRRAAELRLPGFLNAAFKVAMSMLHDRQEAQDVVGDALAGWLESPSKYNDNYRASDLTWFKIVVKHAAIDVLRHRYVERKPIPVDDGEDPLPEMLEMLREALKSLRADEQRVLLQYLSWDDAPNPGRIGARLGRTLGISDKRATARFTAAVVALRREMLRLMDTADARSGAARPA